MAYALKGDFAEDGRLRDRGVLLIERDGDEWRNAENGLTIKATQFRRDPVEISWGWPAVFWPDAGECERVGLPIDVS